MILSEILEQVDTLVPNSINVTTKISWINHVQNQLYRDYPFPEAAGKIHIKRGQDLYTLPADCTEDRIEEAVIHGEHYPFLALTSEAFGQFCTIVTGLLLIHPTPLGDTTGMLFYKQRPKQLTADDMGVAPTFPLDFHELLVLGCASRVAKSDPTTFNLSAVFVDDYRRLAEKADLVLKRKQPRQTTLVRGWM